MLSWVEHEKSFITYGDGEGGGGIKQILVEI